MKIGLLSKNTGVIIETIRYYEKQGLMRPPRRTESGQRVYNKDDEQRLRFIKTCRNLDFSMADIISLLALCEETPTNCGAVRALAETNIDRLQIKMRAIKGMLATLSGLTEQCKIGNTPDCPLVDQLMEMPRA